MTLVEEILQDLLNTSLRYKGIRVNYFGIPKSKKYSEKSFKSTFYRLHKNELIEKEGATWKITKQGKKYLERKANSLINFDNKFNKNAPKNLLVMFDIPENKKVEREWFRWHLKKFNYEMIQRSVWVGPSPLPKEFLDYIEKIKLKNSIKTFKLAKSYDKMKSQQSQR